MKQGGEMLLLFVPSFIPQKKTALIFSPFHSQAVLMKRGNRDKRNGWGRDLKRK